MHDLRMQIRLSKLIEQRFAAARGIHRDQHAPVVAVEKALEFPCRCFAAPVDRQLRRRQRAEVDRMWIRAGRDEFGAQVPVQLLAQPIRRQIQLGHGQDRPFDVVGATVVASLCLLPERIGCGERVFRQHEQRIRAEVIEQVFGALEEQRQVILDPCRRRAFLQILIERAMARIDGETLAQRVAKDLGRFVREREFARRQQAVLFPLYAANAASPDRSCGSNRFRGRTIRCDTARPRPSGKCRSGRRARRSLRVRILAVRCDSLRPAGAAVRWPDPGAGAVPASGSIRR